eukprot:13042568-Heterocapsa_arctica.AAC.1
MYQGCGRDLDKPDHEGRHGEVHTGSRVPLPDKQLRRAEGHHGAGGLAGKDHQSTRNNLMVESKKEEDNMVNTKEFYKAINMLKEMSEDA